MKRALAIGLVVVAVIGIAALAFRTGSDRSDPVKLVSASIALPADTAVLPPGPHAALVTARCTACHSAEMILTQPPLKAEQWQATVTKMREVYRADLPVSDDPAILAYLAGLSAAKTKEPS